RSRHLNPIWRAALSRHFSRGMDSEVLRWLDVESLFRVKVKVSLFCSYQLCLVMALIIEQKPLCREARPVIAQPRSKIPLEQVQEAGQRQSRDLATPAPPGARVRHSSGSSYLRTYRRICRPDRYPYPGRIAWRSSALLPGAPAHRPRFRESPLKSAPPSPA